MRTVTQAVLDVDTPIFLFSRFEYFISRKTESHQRKPMPTHIDLGSLHERAFVNEEGWMETLTVSLLIASWNSSSMIHDSFGTNEKNNQIYELNSLSNDLIPNFPLAYFNGFHFDSFLWYKNGKNPSSGCWVISLYSNFQISPENRWNQCGPFSRTTMLEKYYNFGVLHPQIDFMLKKSNQFFFRRSFVDLLVALREWKWTYPSHVDSFWKIFWRNRWSFSNNG